MKNTQKNRLSPLKQAFLALEKMQAKLDALEQARSEPIAIVGMSCRVPGASDPEAFWQLLYEGVDAITEVPRERWDIEQYYDPDPDAGGKMRTRFGGFIEQIDQFDPLFFGISPREAVSLDPQQRLLLEVSWEALERAGVAHERLAISQTGVFVGITTNEYAQLLISSGAELDAYFNSGNALNAAAGRLSYTLGLQGPCMAIDTACSSSLVAVHLAVMSLRVGECEQALAGGVNLILSPGGSVALSQAGMLAPDGRCKTFDASADGYVRSEGCGMVLLKRLSDAQRDGDQILALIRGSAVNQDGPSSGLTVPNGPAQQALIRQALKNGNLSPEEVTYIEAHGTGTSLGDPIEVGALGAVFAKRDKPLLIGSVKSNIGHLESAAGITGLMKVVLSLQNQQIPAHLHFEQPNPHINWDMLPVEVTKERIPWPLSSQNGGQIAGVSSFGASGTNAHVILEAASSARGRGSEGARGRNDNAATPSPTPPIPHSQKHPLHLLTLSAKTEEALHELAVRYDRHLAEHPHDSLANICFTANSGRVHHSHRLALIAESSEQLREKLSKYTAGEPSEQIGVWQGHSKSTAETNIAFLFTGQGSQYVGMGRELYETEPTFRFWLERCDELLRPYLDQPLLSVLYPTNNQYPKGTQSPISNLTYPAKSGQSPINQTTYTQPALFALEYALAKLWDGWGIQPTMVMGHSVGELVAACVAGVFSLEDGLKLIAERGRLMGTLPRNGEMVAVLASEAQVASVIGTSYAQHLSIAAINGPKSVVISGARWAIRRVVALLGRKGIKSKKLTVSHAFHSPLMASILDQFERVAQSVTYSEPQIGLVSNLTGQIVTSEVTNAEYWRRHIREAVRFADGMKTLHEMGFNTFVEIGPQPTLLAMARRCWPGSDFSMTYNGSNTVKNNNFLPSLWLPSLRPGQKENSNWSQLLQSLAQLYGRGAPIDWAGFYAPPGESTNRDEALGYRRVLLPTYPWTRQRYWPEWHPPRQDGYQEQQLAASKSAWSPLFELLHQGDRTQLTQMLAEAAHFSAEQLHHLPAFVDILIKQHQEQVVAASLDDWLYEVAWQAKPRFSPASASEPGHWLIVAAQGGVAARLADLLEEDGHRCLLVNPLSNDPSLVVDEAFDPPLTGVVYIKEAERLESSPAEAALEACADLLQLMQALLKNGERAKLWIVTRGAHAINGQPPSVTQAPLWGFGKVIAQEHPALWGGMLDLDPNQDEDEHQAAMLLAELRDSQGEDELAFRDGVRLVARLVRHAHPEADRLTNKSDDMFLRSDSSYLITGGLGALGLRTACGMVEMGVRHLVLSSRSGISSEAAQKGVEQLEEAGCEVHVIKADVSNSLDVAQLFSLTELREETSSKTMPPIRGIVHAAGVLDDGILLRQDVERFKRVMEPKVAGTWNLHQASQALPLDFFICFSSATSILGSPGQANYAAANAFMDGLCHYRHAHGLPALSINWGPWASSGMAAQSNLPTNWQQIGVTPITPDQGWQLFKSLLGVERPQLSVLPAEWSRFGSWRPFLSDLINKHGEQSEAEQLLQYQALRLRLEEAPISDRQELLMLYLQEEVGQILAIQEPDVYQGFADMGMDSLMALELSNRLEVALAHSWPPTLALEYPTIETLADYLATTLWHPTSSLSDVEGETKHVRKEEGIEADHEALDGEKTLEEIKQLSEDELEGLIDDKIGAFLDGIWEIGD